MRGATARSYGLAPLVAFLSSLGAPLCQAEIYTFSQWQVPAAGGIQVLHAFYVFAPKDTKQHPPKVSFNKLVAKPSDKSAPTLAAFRSVEETYRGIQVHVMLWDEYSAYVNLNKYCFKPENGHQPHIWLTLPAEVDLGDVNLYSAAVRLNSTDATVVRPSTLGFTGVWVLFVTNCGDFDLARLSGEVEVTSSYGYLPGVEFHKRSVRYALLVAYFVVSLFWAYQYTQQTEGFGILHHGLTAVLVIGFIDCLFWFLFYLFWNLHGFRNVALLGTASMLSVLKTIALATLLPILASGWYVTAADVSEEVVWRTKLIAICYCVVDTAWKFVVHFRSRESLTLMTVVLASIPVYALHSGVLAWVHRLSSETMRTLRDRGQTEKLYVYVTFQRVVLGSVFLVALSLCGEVIVAQDSVHRWRFQWLATDGITQPLFLVFVVILMLLWGPGSVSPGSADLEVDKAVAAEDRPLVAAMSEDEEEEDAEAAVFSSSVLAPTKLGAVAALS